MAKRVSPSVGLEPTNSKRSHHDPSSSNVHHLSLLTQGDPNDVAAPTPSPIKSAAILTPTQPTQVDDQNTGNIKRKIEFQDGLPKLLFDSMQSNDLEVVVEAVATLAAKVKDIPANELEEFLASGVHSFVVMCMYKWCGSSVRIQAECCCAIARIIGRCDNKTSRSTISKIVSSFHNNNAVELVMNALESFPEDERLQSYGVVALGNLLFSMDNARDSSGTGNTSGHAKSVAAKLVGPLDAVSIVAKAMVKFQHSENLQSFSCWFLKRLCDLGMAKAPAMIEQGLVVVAAAVQSHPKNKAIAQNTLSFIKAVVTPLT